MTLFLHELHEVVGRREEDFEAAVREGFLPALARDDDARLLYYLKHAHGSGPSYRVVTVTAVRDGAAWERLMRRVHEGDLYGWARDVDALRHDVTAKMLVPLPWSPLAEVDLEAVPTRGVERDPVVFMEDTVRPYEGGLERYVERAGAHYAREMERHKATGRALLEVLGGFRTAFGAGLRREIVLWQKIVQPRMLVPLLTREVPPEYRKPGTWMHDGLEVRDRWESRLLRTVPWSPWA